MSYHTSELAKQIVETPGGATVMILGKSGHGKTHLLESIRISCAQQDLVCLVGNCRYSQLAPLQGLMPILTDLLQRVQPLSPAFLAQYGSYLTLLDRDGKNSYPRNSLDFVPVEGVYAFLRATVGLVRTVIDTLPGERLIICVDDAHHADALSLFFLETLVRQRLPGLTLAVTSVSPLPALDMPEVKHITLRGLSAEVAGSLGGGGVHDFAWIDRISRGNGHWVMECAFHQVGSTPLPSSRRALLKNAWERLTTQERLRLAGSYVMENSCRPLAAFCYQKLAISDKARLHLETAERQKQLVLRAEHLRKGGRRGAAAQTLLEAGMLLLNAGIYTQAAELFNRGLRTVGRRAPLALRWQLVYQYATAMLNLRNGPEAARVLQAFLAETESIGVRIMALPALAMALTRFATSPDPQTGLQLLTTASDLVDEHTHLVVNPVAERIRINSSKSYMLGLLGRLEEAENLLHDGLETLRTLDNRPIYQHLRSLLALNLGQLAVQQKRFAEAVDMFTLALDYVPSHNKLFRYRAWALYALGDTQRAREDLDRLVTSTPFNPGAYVQRARLLRLMGEREAAEADCLTALDLAPNHQEALAEWRSLHADDPRE